MPPGPANRPHCYAELPVSSQATAMTTANTHRTATNDSTINIVQIFFYCDEASIYVSITAHFFHSIHDAEV